MYFETLNPIRTAVMKPKKQAKQTTANANENMGEKALRAAGEHGHWSRHGGNW